MSGISRRDLLKRSAVAGTVLWATPALTSASAWGQGVTCDCDGTTLYTKLPGLAGNDAQTCGNQCLNPDNLEAIGFGCLEDLGYIATTITSDNEATVEFADNIALTRMAMKVSESCYMITCVEDFGDVWVFSNSEQTEPKHQPPLTDQNPPLFTFEDGNGAALGDSNSGVPSGSTVRKIHWRSDALQHKVNFVEFILCIQNASRIPCEIVDC